MEGLFLSLFYGYPEILLALACFFLFRILHHGSAHPVNWPVLGMLPDLLLHVHRLHDWATDILRETSCTFVFKGPWFSGMDFLATCDPANVNQIFNTNFSNYPKGDDFLEMFDILGDGIFNADSESWKRQRRMAHALISDRRFRCFVAETSRAKVEKGLIPFLEHAALADEVFDLQDIFLRFTFDNTCSLVFGVDPGGLSADLPTVPFAKAMDDAEEAILYRHVMPRSWWKLFKWLGIGEEKKLTLAWEIIDKFIAKHISLRVEEMNRFRETAITMGVTSRSADSADLLTSYLDNQEEEGIIKCTESHKFLRDTTLNFMLAGRDTTGSALTWFFWLLSKNPDVETKILEELKTTHDEPDHNSELYGHGQKESRQLTMFDSDQLSTLVYLHAALCESLRLFPPVPFEHKAVLQPEILPSGHRVDHKTKIYFFLYSMGRMKGIWGKDCCEFKPERWISGHGTLKHEPSYKFLSFNAGPRTCLGKDMAFTQMKAVAAAMIYNFHVQVVEGHVVAPKISVILHMKNGLMVRVKKRRAI